MAIVRGLYKKGCSKQDVINLFRFIDWIMSLPEKEEKLFWQELEIYEKEENMRYITSVEKIGYEKGAMVGYEKGEVIGYEKGEIVGYEKGGQKTGAFVAAKLIAKKYMSDMEYELTYLAGLDADDLVELCGVNLFLILTL